MFLLKNITAYKVNENVSIEKTDDEQTNNMMLFHGSTVENSVGILENGFKNSDDGKWGKGLYLTACSDLAIMYSRSRTLKLKNKTKTHCIFINEVLNSKGMEIEPQIQDLYERQKKMEDPFIYFFNISCDKLEQNEENFKKDEKGRIYRFAPIRKYENFDEYKADANVVKPRYYLEFEQTRNESLWDQFDNFVDEYCKMTRREKTRPKMTRRKMLVRKMTRRKNRASNCSSIISDCISEC